MDDGASAPPLTYEDTTRILARLNDLEHPIVLVGGQAVNFWASYYEGRVKALAEGGPYASKDIDFVGSRPAVEECARRLGGQARTATMDDHSPNSGVVVFVDDKYTRQIDFLFEAYGAELDETYGTSIAADILDKDGDVVATFRVMNPLLVLLSRAANVANLPGYQTDHALGQLRAAICCARAFIEDALATAPCEAQAMNERIFSLAQWGPGPTVFVKYGIDVLEAAVLSAPGMPELFYSKRVPFVREAIARARKKRAAAEERARNAAAAAIATKKPAR